MKPIIRLLIVLLTILFVIGIFLLIKYSTRTSKANTYRSFSYRTSSPSKYSSYSIHSAEDDTIYSTYSDWFFTPRWKYYTSYSINREKIVSKLSNEVDKMEKLLEKKPNVTMVKISLDSCHNIIMKNNEKFYKKGNVAIVNAADAKFNTEATGFNSQVRGFVADKNGTSGYNWNNLRDISTSKYSDRIRISSFNDGYVLHLVGLQMKELQKLQLKIEDVDEYLIGLYLNGLTEIEKLIPKGNVLMFCDFKYFYTMTGFDCDGVKFYKEEFTLRTKLACFTAVNRYKGKLKIVLNLL
ncbi:hypothetical protein H311_00266 [Anncaliia algerae PRA109]|nr:hypothetical protein H311_00266 [Anncaliia algerae PRA109]